MALTSEEKQRIRNFIWDETDGTDFVLLSDVDGWWVDICGVVVEGVSPADVLERVVRILREA